MNDSETPPRRLTTVETAKIMRGALKAGFPGVKFSVRSSGSSIRVEWTDGPTTAQVSEVSQLYRGATFDGMIDLETPHYSLLTTDAGAELVSFGSKYVFQDREISPEWEAELYAKLAAFIGARNLEPEEMVSGVMALSKSQARHTDLEVGDLFADRQGFEEPACRIVRAMSWEVAR